MAGWSGGTFTRAHDWTGDAAAGTNIEASRMDTEDDNFTTGINACLHKGGQNAATADLPMGTNKHTGVGNGSARTHYGAIGQVQDGAFHYAASAGTNTVTLTLSPAITAYAAGQHFVFKAGGTNTGATTLNVNSVGAKNIYINGAALIGGEIASGNIYEVVYDGTQFQLVTQSLPIGHGCHVNMSGAVSVPDSGSGDLECDTEVFDTDGLHSVASNTERITVPSHLYGLWAFSASISINPPSGVDGAVLVRIVEPGNLAIADTKIYMNETDTQNVSLHGLWKMDASDPYAKCIVFNDTGQACDIQVLAFSGYFIGKA